MDIYFKNKKNEKTCTKFEFAAKIHGVRCSKLIFQRVSELQSAKNLLEIDKLRSPRLHWLSGNRKHQCAVDLVHPKRLIFEPQENTSKEFIEINIIEIQEITDYH